MGRAKAARTEVALATFHWQPRSREEWMNEGCRSRPFLPLHSWRSQLGSGAAHCELVFSPPLTWSVQSPTCLPRWPSPRWFHPLSSWQVKLIITGRTWLCLVPSWKWLTKVSVGLVTTEPMVRLLGPDAAHGEFKFCFGVYLGVVAVYLYILKIINPISLYHRNSFLFQINGVLFVLPQ